MTQNNAVEVNPGAVVSKVAVVIGLAILAVVVTVGGFTRAALGGSIQPPTLVSVSGLDAGAFELLAKPAPQPREIAVVTTDAGSKKFDNSDRRGEFKVRMDVLAGEIGQRYGDNVTVETIYFAVNNTEKADAAIVAFKGEKMKQTTVVFFIFQNDAWKTFPTDFQ